MICFTIHSYGKEFKFCQVKKEMKVLRQTE